MTQIVVPASPLVAVTKYLRECFAADGDPVRVASDVPNNPPADLITVDVVGGSVPDPVTTVPRIAVQSWAPTKTAAEARAYLLVSFLENAPYEFARAVDIEAGPYEFPESSGKFFRYQVIASLWLARRLR